MNELLRGVESAERKSTSIETYRELSAFSRLHEWDNLTAEDQRVVLAEGIEPSHVPSIGGKSDAGAGGDRQRGGQTDMNRRLRDAHHGIYEE